MLNDEQVKQSLKECITTLVNEKRRSTEQYFDGYAIAVDVSKRQISVVVYTTKPSAMLTLPMVDEEYACVYYDLRSHLYTRENNSALLKDSVLNLTRLYKTGKLFILQNQ